MSTHSSTDLAGGRNTISPTPSTTEAAKPALQNAFQRWTDVSRFTFSESAAGEMGDVTIGFYPLEHGDGEPFKKTTLGHGFAPPDGRLHFNQEQPWSFLSDGPQAVFADLETVAVHEIGLNHSEDKAAIMYGEISLCQIKRDLTRDDVDGITSLYADH